MVLFLHGCVAVARTSRGCRTGARLGAEGRTSLGHQCAHQSNIFAPSDYYSCNYLPLSEE